MSAPLFVTGTARSGSTLLANSLSAHPEVMVANDPCFFLFKQLQRAITGQAGPIQDYYFSDANLRQLDAIQNGSLETPADISKWDAGVMASARARLREECADLEPLFDELKGKSHKELFQSMLGIIERGRPAARRRWVGMKEVWVIEFFSLLASAFTEARFIVILRDPRATVDSMFGFRESDPSQIANTLSYLRHWRKQAAFLLHFQKQPLFNDRLLAVRYEDLVSDPARSAEKMCRFLGIAMDERMADAKSFKDPSKKGTWKANSSHGELAGISTKPAERWKKTLPAEVVRTADLVCGPEMGLFGYEEFSGGSQEGVLDYLRKNGEEPGSWRTDSGDALKEFNSEKARRKLLAEAKKPEAAMLRRNFLFEEVYEALIDRSKQAVAS